MTYTLTYFLPCLTALIWSILFMVKPKKTTSQKLYLATSWLLTFYHLCNAIFFLPQTNYQVLVRVDMICVPVSLSLVALSVIYLYAQLPGSKIKGVSFLLLIPALIVGTMTILMYYLVGFDEAAKMVESYDMIGHRSTDFRSTLMNTYVFIDVYLASYISVPFYFASIFLFILIMLKGSRTSRWKASLVITGQFLILPYIILGRKFMFTHPGITTVVMVLLAIQKFTLAYIEYYSTESRRKNSDEDPGEDRTRLQLVLKNFTKAMEEGAYKDEDISLERLADNLGTSKTFLSHAINKEFKTSFRDLLNQYRVESAKKYMMEHPHAKQSEVASECGFKDNSSFNRKFKEQEGCTPLLWITKNISGTAGMLTVLMLLLGGTNLHAQDKYMIHFEPDKKIIYTELLGMPDHTLVTDVLHVLPELINRGDLAFEKFDLQYDGKSIGESRDVILSQMRIADIEKIEISTSAVATHANNGQSGSINIVPAKKKEGLHGRAFLEGDLFWGVMPGVNLNYKKNKAEFAALVNLEAMKTGQDRSFVETSPYIDRITMESTQNRYFQQTAKFDFHYTFSEKDEIKAWFVESSGDYRVRTISDYTKNTDMSGVYGPGIALVDKGIDTTLTRSQGLILEVNTEYQHHFDKDSKVTVSADWSTRSGEGYEMKNAPYKINTQAKLQARIFGDEFRKLTLKTGINTNIDHFSSPVSDGQALFVSPSAELQYRQKSLSVNAAAQFQYYDKVFRASNSDTEFSNTDKDFTAHLNLVWSMVKDHALKVNLSRNIIRPADQMLYPGFTYYPSTKKWVKGDPSLSNAYIHSMELNYIHEWARREHEMVMNFGVGYDLASGVHEENTRIQTVEPYIYSIYCNTGKSNILKGNMMLIYKYQAMTLSFAGNVFFNSNENIARQRPFYNLSISPVFNFHNRWTLTGRILYNSAIQRENSVLGECLFTQAKISKDIKSWTLSLVLNDITGFPSQDYTHGPDKSSFTSGYNLYTRYIGLHVSKRFN